MRSEFETYPSQIDYLLQKIPARKAFSPRSREEIKNRAGGKSELSGLSPQDGHIMHAAHLNHDKNRPDYDDPRNGMYLTVTEHYEQHVNAIGRAREIGLSEKANQWAVNKLENTPAKRVK